jgi:hypothetical protein
MCGIVKEKTLICPSVYRHFKLNIYCTTQTALIPYYGDLGQKTDVALWFNVPDYYAATI